MDSREIIVIHFNRDTGELGVNYTGFNFLEALSVLQIAYNDVYERTTTLDVDFEEGESDDG